MRQCSNAESCIFWIVLQHLNLVPTFVHSCTHGCTRRSVLKPNLNSEDILCPWCSTCPVWRDGAQSQTCVLCSKSVPHFVHHHLRKMPSSKVSLLSCQNPFCLNFNKKLFANQAAYTQHIDRNIGCYNFIVKKSHVAAPHGASVSRRHRLYEDEDVTWTSNKRPSLLRRHMVNDFVGSADSDSFCCLQLMMLRKGV